jgi:hypothetical protein
MDVRTYRRTGDDLEEAGRISARGMVLQKRLFPLWSVLALVLIVVALRQTWPANMVLLPAAIISSIVGSLLLGVAFFKQADDVIDAGDHLIVRRDDEEVRIPLRDVRKVSASFLGVTIHLAQPVQFGPTITFTPQRALGRGAVLMSLKSRLVAARPPN